jgi:Carboxypeptidase regulatory-like domain
MEIRPDSFIPGDIAGDCASVQRTCPLFCGLLLSTTVRRWNNDQPDAVSRVEGFVEETPCPKQGSTESKGELLMLRRVRLLCGLIALILPLVSLLTERMSAQAISGDVIGTVTDGSGAVVPGVKITATNVLTAVKYKAVTNSAGDYRMSNLLPGEYSISAMASGFSALELKGVAIQLNQTATANIQLRVGPVATTVEVNAAPVAMDTTTAQIQTTYSNKQINDLPTNTALRENSIGPAF